MEFKAYETSSAQRRVYVIHQLGKNSVFYNMPCAKIVEGNLDPDLLEKAIKKLIQRHETLRTSFIVKNGKILQKVYDSIHFKLKYTTFPQPEINELTQHFIQPFDLEKVPLWRAELVQLQSNKYLFLFDIHHIISDGVSINLIFDEIMIFYQGKTLPPLEFQYVDFTMWQNDIFNSGKIKHQEEYWLNIFPGEIPVLNMPTDFPRPAGMDIAGVSIEFAIKENLTEKLKTVAAKHKSTLYIVLLAAYNILLSKYTSQEDIIVGTPTGGRPQPELEKIVGMFVNTLAMRNRPVPEKTIEAFLQEVSANAISAFDNQDYPFEMLVEKLNVERQLNRNPLFDTMLVLQNFPREIKVPGQDNERLKFIPYPIKERVAKFDLALSAFETGQKIIFELEYRTSLFMKETIQRLINHFTRILQTVAKNPQLKISKIRMITVEEKYHLLYTLNNTEVDYPEAEDKTIHQFFEEQAEITPDHVALVGADGDLSLPEDMYIITYRELNVRSNRLVHLLKEKGVESNTLIALMVTPSIKMALGMLGILKAGGAYLPIDPNYPGERIKFILEDSNAKVLVTTRALAEEAEKMRRYEGERIFLDVGNWHACTPAEHSHTQPRNHSNTQLNLAYVIYTSGSTGKPKGVMVQHRGFINLVSVHQHVFGEKPVERMSQVANPSFDAMAFEVWPCLLSGAALYIADNEIRMHPVNMKQWLIANAITITFQPTAMAEHLLKEEWPKKGVALKTLRTAGDQLKTYPLYSCIFRVYNLYGPTEDTIWTTWTEVKPNQSNKKYPSIGKPIANHRVYIIDPDFNLQPLGIPGELCIAGEGLAVGYLNRPELTAEKFIEQVAGAGDRRRWKYTTSNKKLLQGAMRKAPCAKRFPPGRRRQKVYRTGDLVRWLPSGDIEFLGRIDNQVKIRGFRIETREIEIYLSNHDSINEVVVLVKEDNNRDKYLCAYITCRNEPKVSASELREFLSEFLPTYMIPSYFVILDTIPLTPNGKIDRKALPAPKVVTEKSQVPPRNEIEKKLSVIWSEVLSHPQVGIDDNFFQLGGHSLKATAAISRIQKELNIKLPLIEFFKTPTIRGLVDSLKSPGYRKYKSIPPVEKREYYELSSAQKRLYILQQGDMKNTSYNMTEIYIFKGKLNQQTFEAAFQGIIDQHEALRTSFCQVSGEVFQKIEDHVSLKLAYKKISDEKEITNQVREFVKPFDLSRAPLFRAELIKLNEKKHLVLFDIHHIISDGSSMWLLMKDFVRLYQGKPIEPLLVHYKDYTPWQDKLLNKKKEEHEAYWLEELKGFVFTRFPPDHFDSYKRVEGKMQRLDIQALLYDKIEAFCNKHDITKFTFMIMVFEIVLAREIDQADITVGTPISIKNHHDLKHIMGIFLNVVLIRTVINEKNTFLNHLAKSKETVIGALNHQDYPYDKLHTKMNEIYDLKNDELFSILFNYLPVEENKEIMIEDFKIHSLELPEVIPKYDMTLYVYDAYTQKSMVLNLVYKSNIYDAYTIKSVLKGVLDVIHRILENENIKLSQLTLPGEMDEENYNDLDMKFEKMYESEYDYN